MEMIMEELQEYLTVLEEDLEIEVDLHGGRTELAKDLRTLIIATKLQLDQ